jgi:GxxExxY protein
MSTDQNKTELRFSGKHAELTDRIIAVFFDVYNELGYGFLESVYHSAMNIALQQKGSRWLWSIRFRSTFAR